MRLMHIQGPESDGQIVYSMSIARTMMGSTSYVDVIWEAMQKLSEQAHRNGMPSIPNIPPTPAFLGKTVNWMGRRYFIPWPCYSDPTCTVMVVSGPDGLIEVRHSDGSRPTGPTSTNVRVFSEANMMFAISRVVRQAHNVAPGGLIEVREETIEDEIPMEIG